MNKGEFIILRNGILEKYEDYDLIPLDFDHVISFKPSVPEPPHSKDEHELIHTWNEKLQRLIQIEKNNKRK